MQNDQEQPKEQEPISDTQGNTESTTVEEKDPGTPLPEPPSPDNPGATTADLNDADIKEAASDAPQDAQRSSF